MIPPFVSHVCKASAAALTSVADWQATSTSRQMASLNTAMTAPVGRRYDAVSCSSSSQRNDTQLWSQRCVSVQRSSLVLGSLARHSSAVAATNGSTDLSALFHAWPFTQKTDIYRPCSRGDKVFGSIHVCATVRVCPFALGTLLFEPLDLDFWHEGRSWSWIAWDCRSRS